MAAGVRAVGGQRAGVRHRCDLTGNLRPRSGTPLRLALLAAVLDVGANVAMLLALQASLLSLAGVLMSLYPAATVLLAIVVLRERVTRWQAVGMVLALASVAMIRLDGPGAAGGPAFLGDPPSSLGGRLWDSSRSWTPPSPSRG